MTNEEKYQLITRNLDEVITSEDLKNLINSGVPLRHYIGFEISGRVHIGTGIASMLKIRDLQQAGVEVYILLADWHSWLNNKLDGKLETARRLAREYFEEAMKAAAMVAGVNIDKLNFILGTDLYEQEKLSYWTTVIKVSKATTISRMLRSTTIMGKEAGLSSDAATLIYPAMQAADIFHLKVNIAHAGTDQRNVHVLARDVADELHQEKPVMIHHHLLLGLSKPSVWPIPKESREDQILAAKMSKSKPGSAIFIDDSPEEIKEKINNAFAPEGEVEFNPVLDWTKHLIFYLPESMLTIERPEKWGGNVTYSFYEELEKDYQEKKLHPQDLKNAVASWLIEKLAPARQYFANHQSLQKAAQEIAELTSKK